MRNGIPHGKGNSLSPEPCALIPVPVGHPFMSLQGGRDERSDWANALLLAGMNASWTC